MRSLTCGERAILNQDDDTDCAPDLRTFRTGTATARKYHKCAGCDGGQIAPGDPYSYWVGIEEGEFAVVRMCLRGAKTPGCDNDLGRPASSPAQVFGPDEIPF